MKRITTIISILLLLSIMPAAMAARTNSSNRANITRIGKASWYGYDSPGINLRTANNEIFSEQDLTCAIWGVGFNRRIRVTNLENGKTVIVRVNDRGPSEEHVLGGRVIDLTKAAFQSLAPSDQGLVNVEIEFL